MSNVCLRNGWITRTWDVNQAGVQLELDDHILDKKRPLEAGEGNLQVPVNEKVYLVQLSMHCNDSTLWVRLSRSLENGKS